MDGQNDTFSGPTRFHTSQLDLTTGHKVFDKNGFLYTIILRLGKMIKPFLLFPAIHIPKKSHTKKTCYVHLIEYIC
jgi:hypothetical protein